LSQTKTNKIMKKFILILCVAFFGLVSCSDDPDPVTIDTTRPTGGLNVLRSGGFVDQNNSGSTGTAGIGTDTQGKEFLQFNQAFNTKLSTGTVTVFLSTSATFVSSPSTGSPNLFALGPVRAAGENFFAIPAGTSTAKYTHVILWCGAVGVPFGNAELR
jgi:hypothetical protein